MGREDRIRQQGATFIETAPTYDALGRPLREGDEILILVVQPARYTVARIGPVLDPGAPPLTLRLDLVASTSFIAIRGQKNPEFLLVRTVEEIQALVPQLPQPPQRDQE